LYRVIRQTEADPANEGTRLPRRELQQRHAAFAASHACRDGARQSKPPTKQADESACPEPLASRSRIFVDAPVPVTAWRTGVVGPPEEEERKRLMRRLGRPDYSARYGVRHT
jgi:hypothetical protein